MKQAMIALRALRSLIALKGTPAHARTHARTHVRNSMLGSPRIMLGIPRTPCQDSRRCQTVLYPKLYRPSMPRSGPSSPQEQSTPTHESSRRSQEAQQSQQNPIRILIESQKFLNMPRLLIKSQENPYTILVKSQENHRKSDFPFKARVRITV